MELTKDQKNFIVSKYRSVDMERFPFEEKVEIIVDYMLDDNIEDLSDDENGDAHEDLYNTVWEYLEENMVEPIN
jgi:hypothetical protein